MSVILLVIYRLDTINPKHFSSALVKFKDKRHKSLFSMANEYGHEYCLMYAGFEDF